MEDEIKTFDASENVILEEPIQADKPKRKYTRRKKKDQPVVEDVKIKDVDNDVSDIQSDIDLETVKENAEEACESNESSQIDISEEPKQNSDDIVETNVEIKETEQKDDKSTNQIVVSSAKKETINLSEQVKIEVEIDWDEAVHRFVIAKKQIFISRGPSKLSTGRPFVGRLQIVQNTNDLFVKVRYVRSGLGGARYGYAKKSEILKANFEEPKQT